ncbi:MAG: hypothetical protein HY881_21820 [Deltaproteobacteria bacterium]|nr:hypothetical protein [Deltaproteobacteria bacterium]
MRGKHFRAMQAGYTVTIHKADGTTITMGRPRVSEAAYGLYGLFEVGSMQRKKTEKEGLKRKSGTAED